MEQADEAARTCEVFFSIGTSAEVYPAAELPMTARAAGAAVVEINPDKTPLTRHAHFALHGPAGVVLPQLLEVKAKDSGLAFLVRVISRRLGEDTGRDVLVDIGSQMVKIYDGWTKIVRA